MQGTPVLYVPKSRKEVARAYADGTDENGIF